MSVITIQPVKRSENLKNDVLEIMSAHADQKTIRAALKAYTAAMESGISISNCSFSGTEAAAVVDVDDLLDTLPESDV